MFSYIVKPLKLLLIFSVFLSLPVLAEDYSNTINTVKVKSIGDKAVVVDVYIDAENENVKPRLSSRKYKNDKYIIDLMEVTQQGKVSKDTSASGGLLKSKNIKVGKLPGGTARVLIDLDDPDIEVKEVRYHTVKAAPKSAAKTVKSRPDENKKTVKKAAKVTKPVVAKKNKPKNTMSLIAESTKLARKKEAQKSKVKNAKPKEVKKVQKPENLLSKNKTVSSANTNPPEKTVVHKSSQEKPASKMQQKSFGPVIIHKTDKPEKVAMANKPHKENHKVDNAQKKQTEVVQPAENKKPVPVKVSQSGEKVETQVNHKKPEILKLTKSEKLIKHKDAGVIHDLPPANIVLPEQNNHPEPDNNMLAQAENEHPAANVEGAKGSPEALDNKAEAKENTDPEQMPLNFDEENPEESLKVVDVQEKEIDFLGLLLTLIGALVIVIPLIFVAIWVINMFYKGGDSMGLKSLASASGSKFKILASTSLGQGKSIHLVEIKGRQLVIGSTNNSINILTEFDDFDQFVDENQAREFMNQNPQSMKKFKRSRAPLGSFSDLYKNYASGSSDEELEDEY